VPLPGRVPAHTTACSSRGRRHPVTGSENKRSRLGPERRSQTGNAYAPRVTEQPGWHEHASAPGSSGATLTPWAWRQVHSVTSSGNQFGPEPLGLLAGLASIRSGADARRRGETGVSSRRPLVSFSGATGGHQPSNSNGLSRARAAYSRAVVGRRAADPMDVMTSNGGHSTVPCFEHAASNRYGGQRFRSAGLSRRGSPPCARARRRAKIQSSTGRRTTILSGPAPADPPMTRMVAAHLYGNLARDVNQQHPVLRAADPATQPDSMRTGSRSQR